MDIKNNMTKIFISAGEQSGDLHGSNIIHELLKQDTSIKVYGLGDKRMISAGMECIHNMGDKSVMWLHALTKIDEFLKIIKDSSRFFEAEKPDLVILIDYCGLNFYLAKSAKKRNIPVMYYISPQIWAHGQWRVKKLKKLVNKAVIIYPFEESIYKEAGVPVKYVGNPIVDELTKRVPNEERIASLKCEFGGKIVSLLPGSRSQEIKRILPVLLETAKSLSETDDSVKFIVSCSDERHKETIEQLVKQYSVQAKIVDDDITEIAKSSYLCLVGSGTVTLKIAYYLTPMIIIYKISRFAYFIVTPFLQSQYLSLVNKLADEFIVPERLMYKNDYKWVVSQALKLLNNDEARESCINKLRKVRDLINIPGVSKRAAEEAIKMIK